MSNGPSLAAWVCAVSAFGSAAAAQAPGPSRAALVALTEIADIESLALSPDHAKVAFRVVRPSIQHNAYAIEWHVADVRTGRVTRVATGGQAIYDNGLIENDAPVWTPDSRSFFRRALVDGAIGIWQTAADGSANRQVVAGPADVERIAIGGDGSSLTYETGPARGAVEAAERAEYDDGILIDASVDTRQGLYRSAYSHGRLATQRLTGHWVSRDALLWQKPRTWHALDMATLRERAGAVLAPAETSEAKAQGALTVRGPRGEVVTAAREGRAGGVPGRLTVAWPDGRRAECAAPRCRTGRVVALAWRPGRDELIVTQQEPGFLQSLYGFDPATARLRRIADGEGLLSGGRSEWAPCAIAERFALCVSAGAVAPPRLERIDLDSGRRTIVFDPNPGLRARPAPATERFAMPYGDGRSASVVVLSPGGHRQRLPLLVMYYTCPGYLRGGMGDEFPFGPMVEAGFAIACVTYAPMAPGENAVDSYASAQTVIEQVVARLGHRGLVDPKRIGMGGLSFGSEVTMWMAMNTDLLAAAAIASPQPSPSGYWQTAIRGRDAPEVYRSFWGAGSPDSDLAAWRRISPELNVARIRTPLLMQLPEQEVASAMQFYARMTNTATPVELYGFPHESHTKLQPRHRFAVYRRNLDWFRYWLQDYRDADPAQVEQYRRWDALRQRLATSGRVNSAAGS